jgi:hypothetical protein
VDTAPKNLEHGVQGRPELATRTTKAGFFSRRNGLVAVAMGLIAIALGYILHPMM